MPNKTSGFRIFQDEVDVSESGVSGTLKSVCVMVGCNNPAVESNDWDKEYCSNECVANHCRCVKATPEL